MAGKFVYKKFAEVNIEDPFFDSLKDDYPGTANTTGFLEWFQKKSIQGEEALVYSYENNQVGAFMYLKEEDGEPILLKDKVLPAKPRIKIGTLRISEENRGQRLGEGAIGLALWKWRESKREEIYTTVFPEHEDLIIQLLRYGFELQGYNLDGEGVYTKNRGHLSHEDPYKTFPFIHSDFSKGGMLIVEDRYHDTLFPYSRLKNIKQKSMDLYVANGVSKIYVGAALWPHYNVGEPVFIYRKYTGNQGSRGYLSCFTSVCVVTDVIRAKENGRILMSFEELIKRIGNKSVFDEDDIRSRYDSDRTVTVLGLLYCAFFGEGNNINYHWLNNHGYWCKGDVKYPTEAKYSPLDVAEILREANVDVQNLIVD